MLDCEKIHQDLPLYVLGALDEAVHRDVELHLRSCGACRTVEAQYHTLTGQIAVGVDEAGAGVEWDNLQSKVFGAAKEELYAVRQPGWRLGWRRWVAVAAVLMLAPGLAAVILWHNTGAARREIAGTAPTRTASPELWHMAAGGGVVDPSSGDLAASVQGVFLASQNAPTGVVALEAVTGRQRWRWQVSQCRYVTADNHRVYCVVWADDTAELVALDAASGAILWRRRAGAAMSLGNCCRPIILPDQKLAWVAGNGVRLLNAADGEVIWEQTPSEAGMLLCAAADNGNLYVASMRFLCCLDLDGGAERWREELGQRSPFAARPQLDAAAGKVFVACADGADSARLLCIDSQSRQTIWAQPSAPATNLLAVAGAVLLRGPEVQAFDPATGKRLWQRKAAGCGPLTYSDGLVYYVDSSQNGALLALRTSDGQPASQVSGLQSCNAVLAVGQTGYLRTRDGVVRAIALARRF